MKKPNVQFFALIAALALPPSAFAGEDARTTGLDQTNRTHHASDDIKPAKGKVPVADKATSKLEDVIGLPADPDPGTKTLPGGIVETTDTSQATNVVGRTGSGTIFDSNDSATFKGDYRMRMALQAPGATDGSIMTLLEISGDAPMLAFVIKDGDGSVIYSTRLAVYGAGPAMPSMDSKATNAGTKDSGKKDGKPDVKH